MTLVSGRFGGPSCDIEPCSLFLENEHESTICGLRCYSMLTCSQVQTFPPVCVEGAASHLWASLEEAGWLGCGRLSSPASLRLGWQACRRCSTRCSCCG